MSFRPDSDLKAAFSQATRALDAQVDGARAQLVSEGVTIEDRSNRTGFDKSGMPLFLWNRRRIAAPVKSESDGSRRFFSRDRFHASGTSASVH
jgi:hypothetical protein